MDDWIQGRIMRPTGRNAFAVAVLVPGKNICFCEIHCSSLDAGDRRSLNTAVRALRHRSNDLVLVNVALGRYNIETKCWTHCILRYPGIL